MFCDPQALWQQGTVENANGRIRRRLPRDVDPRMLNSRQIIAVCHRLNAKPRKCLGYRTAAEVFRKKLMSGTAPCPNLIRVWVAAQTETTSNGNFMSLADAAGGLTQTLQRRPPRSAIGYNVPSALHFPAASPARRLDQARKLQFPGAKIGRQGSISFTACNFVRIFRGALPCQPKPSIKDGHYYPGRGQGEGRGRN